jgi:transcriptional regulator with XRE-family HTH domain
MMDEWERLREALLQDPATREAYQARKPAFRLATTFAQLRTALGLTQRQLASRAHMTQPEIARLESGTVQPTWETIARLLEALGAEVQVTARDAEGTLIRVQLLTGDHIPAARRAGRGKDAATPLKVAARRDDRVDEASTRVGRVKSA